MARQLGIKGDLRINVRRYIEILRPFGKLTAQEGKVLSEFVLEYYLLKKKVSLYFNIIDFKYKKQRCEFLKSPFSNY